MAFENYTALIAGTIDFMDRADLTTAKLEYSISLMEGFLNRNLRVKEMESQTASLTLTTSALNGTVSIITHPTDFLAWKNIKVSTAPPSEVEIASEVSALTDLVYYPSSGTDSGRPKRATVQNGGTQLWPGEQASSYAYRYRYYAKIPALTASNTTNWLLTAHPDIYFYGAMAYMTSYVKDDPRVPGWQSVFDRAVDELKVASRRDSFSGNPLRPIVKGVV